LRCRDHRQVESEDGWDFLVATRNLQVESRQLAPGHVKIFEFRTE
jgi:hypothetical protein